MQEYLYNAFYGMGITDIIDILIVAFLIYKALGFIRKTGAMELLQGIVLLVIAMILSDILHLYTINWLLKSVIALGAVSIIIIFQPELRRALEQVGRGNILKSSKKLAKEHGKSVVVEILTALESFSRDRTGALIVFEKRVALDSLIEKSGTIVNADISDQILGNIFYEGAPLHDGAVIIRGDRVHAAGCVLPLTARTDIAKELGTRHRAGLGITEHSDALVIIVSEETGIISVAQDGQLDRYMDLKTIEKMLLGIYLKNNEESNRNIFREMYSKIRRDNNAK